MRTANNEAHSFLGAVDKAQELLLGTSGCRSMSKTASTADANTKHT